MALRIVPDTWSYTPAGRYLWDAWIVPVRSPSGVALRAFHLDASREVSAAARHDLAQIRTARSDDGVAWIDEGPALEPGTPGAWDDRAIWTGATLRGEDDWHLFYTGRNHRDGQLQRIGLASSRDGRTFTRRPSFVLEPDPRFYESTEDAPFYKAWRDPALVFDDHERRWHMYFAARTRDGDPLYRGCIGHAVADDLAGPWTCTPPVAAPGVFKEMETPQVLVRNGRVHLFFSTWASDYEPAHAARFGAQSGLHAYVAPSLLGPFSAIDGAAGCVLGSAHRLYTVKLMDDPTQGAAGAQLAYGWRYVDDADRTPIDLCGPWPVEWTAHGLRIDASTPR